MAAKEAVIVKSFCEQCKSEKEHYQLLIQRRDEAEKSGKDKVKDFIKWFIGGWVIGPMLASMALLDRHLICRVCGTKKIENGGTELQ